MICVGSWERTGVHYCIVDHALSMTAKFVRHGAASVSNSETPYPKHPFKFQS